MTRPTPSVPRKTSGNAFLLIEALALPWVAGARGGIESWTATNDAASRAFWKTDKGWLVEWTDPDKPTRLMAMDAQLGKGDVAMKIARWHLNRSLLLAQGNTLNTQTRDAINLMAERRQGALAQKTSALLKRPVAATTTLADILEGYVDFW